MSSRGKSQGSTKTNNKKNFQQGSHHEECCGGSGGGRPERKLTPGEKSREKWMGNLQPFKRRRPCLREHYKVLPGVKKLPVLKICQG